MTEETKEKIESMRVELDRARALRASLPRYTDQWAAACYEIGRLTGEIRRAVMLGGKK